MTSLILQDFKMRAPVMDDLETVAALINADTIAQHGNPEITLEELRLEWEDPEFNLATDTLVVFGPDGRAAGFGEFWDDPERRAEQIQTNLYIHPDYYGQRVGNYLLQWAERRAQEALTKAGRESASGLRGSIWSGNQEQKQAYKQEGFEIIWNTLRMQIELKEAPPTPQWPEGINVRRFVPEQDEQIVYDLRQIAFADMRGFVSIPLEVWVYHLIKSEAHFDPDLWFLAFAGDELVGYCLCNPGLTEDPELGWVKNLAVRRDWRKRGLGHALLLHAFGELYQRDFSRVGLSVDSQSPTGAHRLYERVGMRPVRRRDHYEKQIQPAR